MRTAYRCRAYPGEQQQVLLNRTFGCVRVVRNRTLAARYAAERRSTSYAATDRALTVLKRDPELAWLKVTWSWSGTSLAAVNPTSVTVARDAAGR